jgi:ferredoxin-thioredoxin reductase catalytic subunit
MRIIVNPDKEVVKEVREGLKRTGGYCPCRVAKNEDTKCLCKEFREQTCEGECYCGLYIKVK